VSFDLTQIGIKGSPTIVGKAFTPPPREAGEVLSVAERGLQVSVAHALTMIDKAGVLAARE
jgi:electron transfer flavoprotein beta subunit